MLSPQVSASTEGEQDSEEADDGLEGSRKKKKRRQGPIEKTFEVCASEMETRMRAWMLKLMKNTLDQMGEISARFDHIMERLQKCEDIADSCELMKESIAQAKSERQVLVDEIEKRDQRVTDLERTTMEQFNDIRTGSRQLDLRCDSLLRDIQRLQGEQAKAWEDRKRLQTQQEQSTETIWQAFHKQASSGGEQHQELSRQIHTLQVQREDLLESLYGSGKGLPAIRDNIVELQNAILPLPELERNILDAHELIVHIRNDTRQNTELCGELKKSVEKNRQHFTTELETFKTHLVQKCNELTAFSTTIMKDIRRDYDDELGKIKDQRQELADFYVRTKGIVESMELNTDTVQRGVQALDAELRREIDELQRAARRDRVDVESKFRSVTKEHESYLQLSRSIKTGFEGVAKMLGIVLEGERITNAMLVQDFADRSEETWLVAPGDIRGRAPARTARELEDPKLTACTRLPGNAVTLDRRKPLQEDFYIPGQVSYSGRSYDRAEILILHHKLLQAAVQAYDQGFASDAVTYVLPTKLIPKAPTMQPGANGGFEAGMQLQKAQMMPPYRRIGKKGSDDWTEDLRDIGSAHSSSTGPRGHSRQRPASQGQPQAMGSRGGTAGSLGETEPFGSHSAMLGPLGEKTATVVPEEEQDFVVSQPLASSRRPSSKRVSEASATAGSNKSTNGTLPALPGVALASASASRRSRGGAGALGNILPRGGSLSAR
eukprot:TRINITY_DN8256_c0_g1_i1.p1 TRINITY_DN8256_c0_g1~~TRINITY_DN8256_c0_g1_i1.p1  ORF type:complete len:721 (+),score=172.15 TRINITY_DN8256_c0_g1_i1:128-2290(+)